MATYSIRELEYLSDIKAHTIRIWEQRYGIVVPKRTPTNIRYYDDTDLRKLLNISFLNHHGHKISKIASLSSKEIVDLVEAISANRAEYKTQINTLVLAMVNLDESRFNQVLSLHIAEEGFEAVALNIIFPFLEKVGILWQTGEVNPAQEHFISSLIRQKLLAAIDTIPKEKLNTQKKKAIFFLPEGEWHEIGLLFAYFVAKTRGITCIYLGQSLPFKDLEGTNLLFSPDIIVSAITSSPANEKALEYAKKMKQTFPNVKIVLSGYQILKQKELLPAEIFVLENINQWIHFLEEKTVALQDC
jgi:MerR family transcriptional regulator, light-induced transcriptional regulator